MIRRRVFSRGVQVLVTLILCDLIPLVWAASHAGAYVIDSHWPSGNQNLTILNTRPDLGWGDVIRGAIGQWNAAGANIRLTYAEQQMNCPDDWPDNEVPFCYDTAIVAGRYGITDWGYTGADHQHTAWAIICVDPVQPGINKPLVACHELGHVLGISHGDNDPTACTRDGTTRPNEQEMLRQIYAHSDAGVTSSTAVPTTQTPVTTAAPVATTSIPGSASVARSTTTTAASTPTSAVATSVPTTPPLAATTSSSTIGRTTVEPPSSAPVASSGGVGSSLTDLEPKWASAKHASSKEQLVLSAVLALGGLLVVSYYRRRLTRR